MRELYQKILKWPWIADFIELYKASEMTMSSIAVAYYLLLAMFPMIMVLANILPFLNLNLDRILDYIQNHVSEDIYAIVSTVVQSVLSRPNLGLLSLSALLGLYTFSKAMVALERAINKSYGVVTHRGFLLSNIFSLIVGLCILSVLYLATFISSFGQTLLTEAYLNLKFDSAIYLTLRKWTTPTIVFFIFFSLLLLYLLLANIKIKKLRYILPGTIFSTTVLVSLTNLLGQYLTKMLSTLLDIKAISSLVIFAFMVWFVFIARILIIGSVLNAVYQKRREGDFELRRGRVLNFIRLNKKKDPESSEPVDTNSD